MNLEKSRLAARTDAGFFLSRFQEIVFLSPASELKQE
jgi:hypothetical protein